MHDKSLTLASALKSTEVDFSGHWQNELKSKMFLSVQGNELSGSYTSQVSANDQQITGDLVGYTNGDLIGFTVNWSNAAITAWVGQLTKNASDIEILKTLWQMTTNIPDADEPTKLWASIFAGADEFTRPAP